MDLSLKNAVARQKIQNIKNLKKIITRLRKRGKCIAFTNGCFDLLHYGHIKYLKAAKKTTDILIVALNSDGSVKKIKGKNRPLTKLRQRMEIVAGLESVDYVTSFKETTPYKIIKILRPDILIKGGDWKTDKIVGTKFVEAYGGKAISVIYDKSISTTKIIKGIDISEKALNDEIKKTSERLYIYPEIAALIIARKKNIDIDEFMADANELIERMVIGKSSTDQSPS